MECDSLKGAIDVVAELVDSGPKYPYMAFRAGTTPFREGMFIHGSQRFATDESVYFRRRR